MCKSLNFENFIEKGRMKYGNKYDYSKVEYKNMQTGVKIICPIHGEFKQTPISHLKSETGCKKCGLLLNSKNRIKSTDKFIKEAREVHGDKYDYSQANYTNCKTAIIIICPVHGEFSQTPNDHLQGGCKKCGVVSSSKTRLKSLEGFIEEAREMHGDKYDYSQVNYINSSTNIVITCLKHGEFKQTPGNHLCGKGCDKCGRHQAGDSLRFSTGKFIEEAMKIHGNKYNYSKVDYVNSVTNVTIICLKHGEFEQSPACHLYSKCGCPHCKESKGEKRVAKYLDELNLLYKRQQKFKKCKCKRMLPFDFIVKIEEKKGFLIEYQGQQHYEITRYRSKTTCSVKRLKNIQKRDQIKKEFCEKNNIPLLIIPYWDYDKIEELIDEFIKNLILKVA